MYALLIHLNILCTTVQFAGLRAPVMEELMYL